MARLSFRCDPSLVERVDLARGDVARELWLRKTVEQALEITEKPRSASVGTTPAPAELPQTVSLGDELDALQRPPLSRSEMFKRAAQK